MSFPSDNENDDSDGLSITIEGDLDIKLEHLSDVPSAMGETYLQNLLIERKTIRKPSAPPSINDSIFCILCLRKCPPGSEVTFGSNGEPNTIDVTEAEEKVIEALDIPIELQYFAMCPTCWQLIEMITDFRQCCEKATKKLKLFPMGLEYDQQDDEWMAKSMQNAIGLKRQMIRKHLDHLDVEETKAKKVARQNMAKKQQTNVVMKVEVSPEGGEDEDDVPNDAQEEPMEEPLHPTASDATETVLLEEDVYEANIFTCEACGRNFDGPMSIRTHKTHCNPDSPSKEKYFSCPICTATFREKSGLGFHLNKHKGIKPFKCRKFCDHTFFSNYTRIKHERRICEQEGRICDICGLHLKNEGSLNMHVKNVHGEAKYICNICGRRFRSSKNHRLHKRVHSDERKYVCTVCNKGFKAPFSLKVHMRTHTQEMSYACHLCDHAFNYKVSLKNHIERNHGPDNY